MGMKLKTILIICLLIVFSGCTNVMVAPEIPTFNNGTTVLTESYEYAVAKGITNSGYIWNKWGYNPDIDSATDPEIIAFYGGQSDQFLSEGEYLLISSSDPNDINGGTGSNAVILWGVNENWERIENEVVFLNGTNPVRTQNKYLGVNRMSTFLSGADLRNDGDITAIAVNSSSIQAEIPAAQGSTQQAFLFIAANHPFLADWIFLNLNKISGGTPRITIRGWVRSFVSQSEYEIFQATIETNTENSIELSPNVPFIVGEKSILYFTAETDTNNAIANLRFSGIEVLNE